MSERTDRALRAAAVPLIVVLVCGFTFLRSVRPSVTGAEARDLAGGIAFDSTVINSTETTRTVREVVPEFQSIRSWISAVGAAVALSDLADTGRVGEACVVDPRDDSVSIVGLVGDDRRTVVLDVPAAHPDRPFAPMGCVPADLDADGDEDLVVYFWGRPPVMFVGDGRSVADLGPDGLPAVELVDGAEIWNSTALNVGDLDGDGHLDLLVANYFPDGLSVLDPDGSAVAPEMQRSMSAATNAGTNRLLLTRPAGRDAAPTVVDATDALPGGTQHAWTLAIGLQDLDGDLVPEVYLANDFGPDHLLHNLSSPSAPAFEVVRGPRTLTTPKSKVLGRDSFKGMGVTFSHGPGTEAPSIFVSNITSQYALQESNFAFVPTDAAPGEVPGYRDDSEALGISRSGWSWDVQAVDLDNDGIDEIAQATGFLAGETDRWPELQELAMGNDALLSNPGAWPTFGPGDDLSGSEPNRLWAFDGERYYDVGDAVGFGSTVVARGIAVGDVDADGRVDLVVANQWAPSVLYRNTTTDAAPVAAVQLRADLGDGRSRTAFGAVLRAEGSTGIAPLRRQIHPANGHASSSSPIVHVPLAADGSRTIEVSWRAADGSPHTSRLTVTSSTRLVLNDDGSVTRDG